MKIKYDFRNDIIYTFHEIIVYISWNFINFKINQAYIYNFKIDEYKRKFDNSIFVWILSLFSSFVKKLWYVKKKIGKLDESNIKNFCKNFAKFNLLIFRLDLTTKPNQTLKPFFDINVYGISVHTFIQRIVGASRIRETWQSNKSCNRVPRLLTNRCKLTGGICLSTAFENEFPNERGASQSFALRISLRTRLMIENIFVWTNISTILIHFGIFFFLIRVTRIYLF